MSEGRPDRDRAKLPSLDLGRFVAAGLVVLFHYGYLLANLRGERPFDLLFRGGHAGVEYFFVLSGFIILYAHRRDIGRPEQVGGFFRKRAIRILPMLWLTLIVWGTLRIVLAGRTTHGATGWDTILLDMLLLPHAGPTVLGVTWTLTRELVFYLLFSLLIVNRRAGIVALIAWQAGVLAATLLRLSLGPWGAALFDVHNLGFGVGLLIAAAGIRGSPGQARAAAWLGALGFAALLLMEWRIGGPVDAELRPLGRWLSPVLYTAAAGLCLAGLAALDARAPRRERPWLQALGGCSYVLYLVHNPVGSIAFRVLDRSPVRLGPEAMMLALAAIAVAAALALHWWIERPLMARLRHWAR